jgi:uncharacterized protein
MNVPSASSLWNSRYNFAIPSFPEFVLYNSSTGAAMKLCGPDAAHVASQLTAPPQMVPVDCFAPELVAELRGGGFLVDAGLDEISAIREQFHVARKLTPIVLTVTTTLDCNLGCYYCYEERSQNYLAFEDVPKLVDLARGRLERSRKSSLHVDWYGGEPLMNLTFLEQASLGLQNLCAMLDVAYSASIISNGTSWPTGIGDFVRQHKIRQVQISFDGLRRNHNRRRHYRTGHSAATRSSFDEAVQLVDELLNHTRVDLRLNIDRGNRNDVLPFIKFARSMRWFKRKYPAVIQPARLASYSDRSSFMRRVELSLDEYEQVRAAIRAEVESRIPVEESEAPDGFPYPRTSVCAALADDSVVLGADGRHYRCGLQVSEPQRAVGNCAASGEGPFRIINQPSATTGTDESWWKSFDPTNLPSCSRCSFLPICWGGCPKKHLEGDRHAIAEQGAYWRKNLARLVATGVGMRCPPAFAFTEADQFRD